MSYSITLTKEQNEMLRNRQRVEKNAKVLKRLQAMSMKASGVSNVKIAEMLGVNINTLTLWIKEYNNNGINGICTLKYKTKDL